MTREELISFYSENAISKELADHLLLSSNKIRLSGAVGSLRSFIIHGAVKHAKGSHLFILNDREEAAYFLNDLEHISDKTIDVLFFPQSYRTPYEATRIDNANIGMRAEVLSAIQKNEKPLAVVTYPTAIAENVVSKKHLSKNTFDLRLGESHNMDFLNDLLVDFEFDKVDLVYQPGQFSIRGGILDIFSFVNEEPYRIEFFGNEIESIRTFDTLTQLSIKKLVHLSVVPNIEEKLLEESRDTFMNFIPEHTSVWIEDVKSCMLRLDKEQEKAQDIYSKLDSPLKHIEPKELFSSSTAFSKKLNDLTVVEMGIQTAFDHSAIIKVDGSPQPTFKKNFDLLIADLSKLAKEKYKLMIAASHESQVERLYKIFEDLNVNIDFTPVMLGLKEGFNDHDNKIVCYTDHQIFERYNKFRLKEGFKKNQQAITIQELMSLKPGDHVTHIDHGIGKFSGMEKLDVGGKQQEAIRLIYKDNDILYVSIHSLHRISKYSGKEGTVPKVNRLGSPAWNKLKSKTKARVKQIAFDLIKLYAKRRSTKGFAFSPDTYLQTELEASFMYEDTPDQLKATQDVKKDMEKDAPMDRLVCGDVGFGKTEIAIRAAFKAVTDSKQVAVLVPTTILSLQHAQTFKRRLKEFPCNIEYLNRFRTAKETTVVLKKVESGEVDILIGTHKLLNKRVKFNDLGLLIIDEEQKFGVGAKDKLKNLKHNVDTLTLTATPIPRTLQFSLMGARDLSIITTPPPNRMPVQTEIHNFNEEFIRDAISYELARGGQVFFVHNRVENIEEVANLIVKLCPDARVQIGHGQMEGAKLEKVMVDFINGYFDVLVSTTIIESGIDIPNANTILINNAHNFGLSDLHQMRGRVGRSNKKAFCYMISPPIFHVSTDARRRLQAIEQFSDLGSGMNIAMRDLDIRGAGDLLGGEQSGFISDIGFDMYHKILNEAIQELKEKEFKDLYEEENEGKLFAKEFQLETDLELLITDEYVISITERLKLYRELNTIENEIELEIFKEQLQDRFGPIPKPTAELISTVRLKWAAQKIGFEKMVLKAGRMIGHFIKDKESKFFASPAFGQVLNFIKEAPEGYKMYEKNDILRLSVDNVFTIEEAIAAIDQIHQKSLLGQN
ncbi:MAG: transcription-repair coupling factor [Flavobacteriales bacterium]|nr:transcription-repair coupling factor [Flavobacteriales bacterium]